MRPAYFVVTCEHGRETPAIYWDELPRSLRDVVYIQRLDLFPNGAELVCTPITDLFAAYQWLKARGRLPPGWEPPPRGKHDAGSSDRDRGASA